MDHRENRIYFKKNIPIKEREDAGTATCMLTKDVILEPNTLNKVEVQLDSDLVVDSLSETGYLWYIYPVTGRIVHYTWKL